MTKVTVVSGGPNKVSVSTTPSSSARAVKPYRVEQLQWFSEGPVEPVVDTHRFYAEQSYIIEAARISVSQPPDRDIIVDILRNGASIYPTPSRRPLIAAGSYTGTGDHGTSELRIGRGEFLSLSVVQSGLVVPGRGLTAQIRLKPVRTGAADLAETLSWSSPGLHLGPLSGAHRIYAQAGYEVESIRASLGTPADRDVRVSLSRNGSPILPGGYLSIPAGSYSVLLTSGFPTALEHDDYLTASILQAGLTQTGGGLTVTMRINLA